MVVKRSFTNFFGGVGHGRSNSQLDFVSDVDRHHIDGSRNLIHPLAATKSKDPLLSAYLTEVSRDVLVRTSTWQVF